MILCYRIMDLTFLILTDCLDDLGLVFLQCHLGNGIYA